MLSQVIGLERPICTSSPWGVASNGYFREIATDSIAEGSQEQEVLNRYPFDAAW